MTSRLHWMPLVDLHHYFVRAHDLEQSRRFYCNGLGFELMPRPPFPFPGYWLGVNGKTQVHLGLDGAPIDRARDKAGVVDHIAFEATEPDALARGLKAAGIPFETRYWAELELFQIFVSDPDGVMIELNFRGQSFEPVPPV
jgi:catechol 2,3-dioxygenase-like lactoylglutathione lyase family enzyme